MMEGAVTLILTLVLNLIISQAFEVNLKAVSSVRRLGGALTTRRQEKLIRASQRSLTEMDMDGWTPPVPMDSYTFIPPVVGPEIYLGSIIALVPIVWATIEFMSRIRVQQECLVCKGTGLVSITKSGSQLARPRKCWNCGGFLPWLGWNYFFFSSFTDPGNGGVLLRPSKDYEEVQDRMKSDPSSLLDALNDGDDEYE